MRLRAVQEGRTTNELRELGCRAAVVVVLGGCVRWIKAAKERLDRFVRAYPSPVPGLTCWAASLPAADSAACWAAIDDLAHRLRGDDPGRTLEQARADAFVDLILTNVEVTTTVRFDTRIARVLLDERTGVVIETGLNTYLPNAAMRRFVQQRDGHCRFPGCARNARRCEPDHVTPHSRGGPTTPWNLASLCKHHHRVKHQAGWSLVMTRDGTCTWTDPHGRQYTTAPTNHHELAA